MFGARVQSGGVPAGAVLAATPHASVNAGLNLAFVGAGGVDGARVGFRHQLSPRRCASDSLLGYPSSGKLNIIAGSAGGVPERLKGADCKSVGLAPTLVRIHPPPPVFGRPQKFGRPPKAATRVECGGNAGRDLGE